MSNERPVRSQDFRLAPDLELANDLDKASQLVTEIKRKALDVEHLLQEDIQASQSSSYGTSITSSEFAPAQSSARQLNLSASVSQPPLSTEEKQMLSDKVRQLEDDLRIEKLKNKSLCNTYTTDVADLMAQVSDLQTQSTVNSTQLFLQQKPSVLSNSVMNTSMAGLPDLGRSVGNRMLHSGYVRDDPSTMALSASESVTSSALMSSMTGPQLGTTLTASKVNPGFMGRLGPEYPDIYDHRYATVNAPNALSVGSFYGGAQGSAHRHLADSIPDPTPTYVPSTPGPASFQGVISINPAIINNHQQILKMMACSKLGALAQLNAIASSMTGSILLTPPQRTISTPAGLGAETYALTPATEFLKRPPSPSNLVYNGFKAPEDNHYERHLQTPGPRRPNYRVRMDTPGDLLKTPITGQDLVNPTLIQNLEFVKLYLSNQLEKSDQVRSLYNSITTMPGFQSAMQIMIESCVEEALTTTSLLEARTIENDVLRTRVTELETALTKTIKGQAEDNVNDRNSNPVCNHSSVSHRINSTGTSPRTQFNNSREAGNMSLDRTGVSVTTISQLGDIQTSSKSMQRILTNYESAIDTLTQMVNSNAAETLRISVDEDEQRREKEIYKSKLHTLASSFEKITQSNYELQKQLDTLRSQSINVTAEQKGVRISQLHDELQAYRAQNAELKAQLERIKETAQAFQESGADDVPVELMIQALVDCIVAKTTDLQKKEQENRVLLEENTKLTAELKSYVARFEEVADQRDTAEKSLKDLRALYVEENKILKEENVLLLEEKRLSEYKNGLLQKKLRTLNDLSEYEYIHGSTRRSSSVDLPVEKDRP